MKMTKLAALLVSTTMLISAFTACGTQKPQSTETKNETSAAAPAKEEKAKEPVKLTFFEEAKNSTNKGFTDALAAFEKETGIKIEFNVVPGEGQDKYKKIDIALMSGDTTDIIKLDSPIQQAKYSDAKLLMPLNDLAKEQNYDLEKMYGKYLKKDASGICNQLPYEVSMNICFYNKKLFDDAKVPYPKGQWTWDQYIDTAKKLTNSSKGIYGNLMQQWEYYLYWQAEAAKVSAYKPDGTSNLDDPAFKNSLKWFNDLSAVHKIQPSWLEMSTKKIGWDSFMTGKYGMQVIGTWFFSLFADGKTYPRDWKFGIAPPPGKDVLAAGGTISINKNSKHAKEAFIFTKWVAENFYSYIGGLPARADWSADDYKKLFQKTCDTFINKDITPDDMYSVLVDNGMGLVPEKISGPACAQINEAFIKESELYLINKKSLDDTMKALVDKANDAIKKEKESK